MSERINKTSIYSIIFLDIIDYSKKAVSSQIEQKETFNIITTKALDGIAQTDRIILDTGDGLAIALLGEPQEALFVALTIRDDILQYNLEHPLGLFVRIGINLGPVRVVKDINGRPNIIGDGINVAERVMSFAKPNQILVSRTYYEVTSRLTDEINVMFSYFGMKQDKHVREHEIYEINAEAKTTKNFAELNVAKQNKTLVAALHPNNMWQNKAQLLKKSFWIDNKYYILGLAALLITTFLFSLPKSAPDITIKTDAVADKVNAVVVAPSKPGNIDQSLDLSNLQNIEPVSLDNTRNTDESKLTESKSADSLKNLEAKNSVSARKLVSKQLNSNLPDVQKPKTLPDSVQPEVKKEAVIERPKQHEPQKIREPVKITPTPIRVAKPISECSQAEKALNQCHH